MGDEPRNFMNDETLDDDELDAIYKRMIDEFIDQANALAESQSPENVGLALLYAASRFNAYVVSKHADTLEDYERDLPRARKFFTRQYGEMLEENLEDYRQLYSKYAHLTRKQ